MRDISTIIERNELFLSESGRRYGLLQLQINGEMTVLPGQFAMLKAHGISEPLLRRAMAFYKVENKANSTSVQFIYQILGRGTGAISQLQSGDKVEFLGPLGNTFDLSSIKDREAILVAGGVGSAALYMLAEQLIEQGIATKLFIGGSSSGDLCGLDDFQSLLSKDNVISATIDGSHGHTGYVTSPLDQYLETQSNTSKIIFACGPEPMLHRVSQSSERFEIPTQLSLESPMACGFGICVGCAVAVKHDCPEGFIYKKVCTDGPVFDYKELHW